MNVPQFTRPALHGRSVSPQTGGPMNKAAVNICVCPVLEQASLQVYTCSESTGSQSVREVSFTRKCPPVLCKAIWFLSNPYSLDYCLFLGKCVGETVPGVGLMPGPSLSAGASCFELTKRQHEMSWHSEKYRQVI